MSNTAAYDSFVKQLVPMAASCRHAQIANRLLHAVLEKNSRWFKSGRVEAKQFDLSHFEGSPLTFVLIEVGEVGDEVHTGSIFSRDYRHYQIGKRGGVRLINAKKKKDQTGRINLVYAVTR